MVAVVCWGAGVAAATLSALLDEMTALQTWPATRAVPIAFGLEMAVPAALAPFLTHRRRRIRWRSWPGSSSRGPASSLLGGSKAVGRAAVAAYSAVTGLFTLPRMADEPQMSPRSSRG